MGLSCGSAKAKLSLTEATIFNGSKAEQSQAMATLHIALVVLLKWQMSQVT